MSEIEVKICGITHLDDAKVALDYGADYLGFVMYSHSPRGIKVRELDRILSNLDGKYKAIGVFVNESRENVGKIAIDCGLHAVQVHGDSEIADEFSDMPVDVWKVVRFQNGNCVPMLGHWPADRYVVDSMTPGEYGGTGAVSDWEHAAPLAKDHSLMLAGGLTPENVKEAIKVVGPCGVDTASGVESEPGRKDHDLIKAFIENAKRD